MKTYLRRAMCSGLAAIALASPAQAEWNARAVHEKPNYKSRGAQYGSESFFTNDVMAATLKWAGRTEATDVDFRRAGPPIKREFIRHDDCDAATGGANPQPEMSCAHITWDDASIVFDFITDLEDAKNVDDPIVAITALDMRTDTQIATMVSVSFTQYGRFDYVGWMKASCYADFYEMASGRPQGCDVPAGDGDRLAVMRASVPIWKMHRAWTQLGGQTAKLALKAKLRSGKDFYFNYSMNNLAEVLFRP
ncbi:hypothetical protein [Pseudooceanicola sp. MF1-13]|uniref:hypothetical protein n=1 Tax=Pseudooceanicola sp. MF1-13 TaxID=3379095 RepID=UPI0038924203